MEKNKVLIESVEQGILHKNPGLIKKTSTREKLEGA